MNEMSSRAFIAEEPVRFTVDEFLDMASVPPLALWEGKLELVEGEIVRMTPPMLPHSLVQRNFFIALHGIFGNGLNGWIVGQEIAVRLLSVENTMRVPDVCLFRIPNGAERIIASDNMLLAIEVAETTLAKDLGIKREYYATAGIPHYWVADINARETHVMSDPANGDYRKRDVISFDAPLTVPGTDQAITLG